MESANLQEMVIAAGSGLIVALLTTLIAFLMGFFKMPPRGYETLPTIAFRPVLWAFVAFIVVKYFITPAVLVTGYYFYAGQALDLQQFEGSLELQAWFNLIFVVILTIAYSIYFFLLQPQTRRNACGTSQSPLKDLFIGASSWLIAYPWVFALSHLLDYITRQFYQGAPIEQVAVQQLRNLTPYPILFSLTAFAVMIVIPVIEELLFRGLLQTWLRGRVGPFAAVIFTSMAFAAVHFSDAQGIFNLSIVPALFVLGLFLGYLRERQGSILAPIGLHSIVNIISFIIILLQEKINETLSSIACFVLNFITWS